MNLNAMIKLQALYYAQGEVCKLNDIMILECLVENPGSRQADIQEFLWGDRNKFRSSISKPILRLESIGLIRRENSMGYRITKKAVKLMGGLK